MTDKCRCNPETSNGGTATWCERCGKPKGFASGPPPASSAAYTPFDAEWLEYDDDTRPVERRTTMLTKHAIVMSALREPYNATEVVFLTTPDEDTGHRETMRLSPDAWRDMGEPDVVTVTVEPGDTLND
jgi:hypothetical protein